MRGGVELLGDFIGGFGLDEGCGVPVVIGDATLDGEVGEGFEDAAPNTPVGYLRRSKHPTRFSLDIKLEP